MSKSISIISSVPLTEPVIRNRLFPFFSSFLAKGYSVHCVCPKSSFSKEQLPEGVLLEEVEIDFYKPDSFIKRALKEATDASLLLKKSKEKSYDVTLVTIPSMFLAFLAPLYLRKKNVVIDVRDLTWEYLSEASLLQKLAKRLFRFLFKRSIGFFKLASVTNETELEYIRKTHTKLEVIHVSNGIRLDQFNQLSGIKISNEERFTVSYIGNIGLAQNLETLINAAELLPEVNFNIVGSGIDEERIKALALNKGLKNVQLTGRVSWSQVVDFYNSTHVLYAQLTPDFSGAMPSKLYEYLSTGKQVIYGGQGQAESTLRKFENSEVIFPCDVNQLVAAIEKLQKKMDRNYLSKVNQKLIEAQYIREKVAELLVNKVHDFV